MSVHECAGHLGISPSTTYELVKSGALPSVKLGVRRVKVPTAALRAFLQMPDTPARENAAGPTADGVSTATPPAPLTNDQEDPCEVYPISDRGRRRSS